MKINSITINNFQCYYGVQTIEFGDGLNLIIGKGGKGKSKLFNALYWVLFGKIYITGGKWCETDDLYNSSDKALRKYEFFNKRALYESKIDGKVICSVELDLDDDKGNNYIIQRQADAIRQPVKEWDKSESWLVNPASVKVTYDTTTGSKPVNGIIAQGIISDLFPTGIRDYIWFQGESLENLIDFRNKATLKKAVQYLSYYPYYEKLTNIVFKAYGEIDRKEKKKLKEANAQNSEARSLVARMEFLRGRIQLEEENKKRYEDNISQIKVALAEDDAKMQGLAGYSELISDYKECEKEIIKINNQLTEIDNYQRSQLPSLWVLRGIDNLIEQCKEIIQSHVKEEAEIPEKKYIDEPSRIKLEEILNKDHRCFVCGSPVDEAHPHAVEWILKRLKDQEEYYKELEDYRNNLEFSKQFNMFIGKIQDYPDFVMRSLKGIDKQFQESSDEIDRLRAKRKKEHDKKDELDKKKDSIKSKHGIDPIKEAGKADTLAANLRVSRKELEKQNKLLDACKASIASYTAEYEEADKMLSKMGMNTGIVTRVAETEWKNISNFLVPICKQVQEKARKELLEKIQERSNEFYKKFTEHDKGYKGRVEIDEDYSITFDGGLNTSHDDRKKMSIINALLALNQKAMKTYYPFISDAPTSNFDPDTTHKYLMGIKDIFDQSIIMTKDVEFGSEKYEDLYNQGNVSHIFQLESQIYSKDSDEPDIWEVSTIVKQLKPQV